MCVNGKTQKQDTKNTQFLLILLPQNLYHKKTLQQNRQRRPAPQQTSEAELLCRYEAGCGLQASHPTHVSNLDLNIYIYMCIVLSKQSVTFMPVWVDTLFVLMRFMIHDAGNAGRFIEILSEAQLGLLL